jgi:hypothetical protein
MSALSSNARWSEDKRYGDTLAITPVLVITIAQKNMEIRSKQARITNVLGIET